MTPQFTSPPNPMVYKAIVWEIVRQIPMGKVATYGQIANLIPPPEGMAANDYAAFGARWVGGAMAASPEGVPWQRVINAQGKISLRDGNNQHAILEEEGIVFDTREKVDLKRFGWEGPDPEWARSRGLVIKGT